MTVAGVPATSVRSSLPSGRAATGELRAALAQRQAELVQAGISLVQRWDAAFPRRAMHVRLVRLAGESNTLLRWRCSAAARSVRGGRFELIDEADLLLRLPAAVRQRLLEIERERIELNFEYALIVYQYQRMTVLMQQRSALAELRALHKAAGESIS